MPFRTLLASAALLASATLAHAHGPTPQKVDETVDVKADPKAVWAVAGDFAGVAKWDDVLKSSEGSNKERTIVFKNGEKLVESVDEYDPGKMTYTYRMSDPNIKALPASSYSATLVVTPKDGGSSVEWYGRVYRADTGNEPAEGQDDAAAKDGLSALFKAGLAGIKAKAEAKS